MALDFLHRRCAPVLLMAALAVGAIAAPAAAKEMTRKKAAKSIRLQVNTSRGVLTDRSDPPFPDAVGSIRAQRYGCKRPRGRLVVCTARWIVHFHKVSDGTDLGLSVCALKVRIAYRSIKPRARKVRYHIRSFVCDPGPTETPPPPPSAEIEVPPPPNAAPAPPPPTAPPTPPGPRAPGPPGTSSGAEAGASQSTPVFYGCSDWDLGGWQGWPYLWTYSCWFYWGGVILEEDVYWWDPISQDDYFWFYWFPSTR